MARTLGQEPGPYGRVLPHGRRLFTGTTGAHGGREEIFLEAAGYPRAAIVRTDALELPSAWLAYVRVADLAATLAKVEPAGGEILVAPDPQIRDGRVAIIRDPLGAALGIAQWSVEEEERQ